MTTASGSTSGRRQPGLRGHRQRTPAGPCGDDEATDIDIDVSGVSTVVGCASIDHVAGGNDRLVESLYRGSWSHKVAAQQVAGAESLRMPDVRVVLSCQWLHKTDPAKTCSDSATFLTDPQKAGNAALVTTVAAGTNGSSLATTYQTSAAYLDVKTSAVNTQGLFWWSRISGDPVPVSSVFPLLSAPLPAVDNLIRAEVPDDPVNNPPEHVTSKPIPVAFLPAPPEVAGAGQQGDAPEFAAVSTLHQRLDDLDLQQPQRHPRRGDRGRDRGLRRVVLGDPCQRGQRRGHG